MKHIFTIALLLMATVFVRAQQPADDEKKLFRPNNIKLNLTTNIWYGPAFLVSYERTVKPYQSVAIEAGYVTFPSLFRDVSDTSIYFGSNKTQSGWKVGAEYRFYFKKENRYEAPHGLYWGPFLSYTSFTNVREVEFFDSTFATGTLEFTGELAMAQFGIDMGYQFVIKDRLTIDLNLFGPAFAYYNASLKLDGDYDVNEENEHLEEIYDYLIESFPVLGQVIEDRGVSSSGRADFFYAGFRYSASVGFRF